MEILFSPRSIFDTADFWIPSLFPNSSKIIARRFLSSFTLSPSLTGITSFFYNSNYLPNAHNYFSEQQYQANIESDAQKEMLYGPILPEERQNERKGNRLNCGRDYTVSTRYEGGERNGKPEQEKSGDKQTTVTQTILLITAILQLIYIVLLLAKELM